MTTGNGETVGPVPRALCAGCDEYWPVRDLDWAGACPNCTDGSPDAVCADCHAHYSAEYSCDCGRRSRYCTGYEDEEYEGAIYDDLDGDWAGCVWILNRPPPAAPHSPRRRVHPRLRRVVRTLARTGVR